MDQQSQRDKLVICPECDGWCEVDCYWCATTHRDDCECCDGLGVLDCPLCIGEGTIPESRARGWREAREAGRVKG